jgi:anaerobic magnesium-protoporphyrin IX monomethyl ester cyclase
MKEKEALDKIKRSKPQIIGIQTMFSIKEKAMEFATRLREDCDILVAGGPLATSNPEEFASTFDVVVLGEGEETTLELAQSVKNGGNIARIPGIVYKENKEIKYTNPRPLMENLDRLPFPARDMFDNEAYKHYYKGSFGYTTTSVMTSRGCPFQCDFCSRPVFGNSFRSRTAANIVDEVETIKKLGYDRVWFADDCFTLNRNRLLGICDELVQRRINIGWECLSRVDTVDSQVAQRMKAAGCIRVFLGLESGNDNVLRIMKKQATVKQAKEAVGAFKQAKVQTGAFFILGYPGENDHTMLDTVDFASSLPLDYLSFTFPYPIPGTGLYEKVENQLSNIDWKEPEGFHLIKHKLLFNSPFSETKLKFAVIKGMFQFYLQKYLGSRFYKMVGRPFQRVTDVIYQHLH